MVLVLVFLTTLFPTYLLVRYQIPQGTTLDLVSATILLSILICACTILCVTLVEAGVTRLVDLMVRWERRTTPYDDADRTRV